MASLASPVFFTQWASTDFHTIPANHRWDGQWFSAAADFAPGAFGHALRHFWLLPLG